MSTPTPLQTTFALRPIIAGFLGSPQPLGVTVLAEDTEKGVKLVGYASDKLEPFFSRFCDTTNNEGKTISNVVSYGESYDGKLIKQYRLTGYVSANGTLQADGVELAVTAVTPKPSEDGKSKETVVSEVYYPVLRGFTNDIAQMPVYLYDSKGAKAPCYYSALFRPQAKSFWIEEAKFDLTELIPQIQGLDVFAAMPGFTFSSATSAAIRLHNANEIATGKALLEALQKDHPQALRPQHPGLRRIDDLSSTTYPSWSVAPNIKERHFKSDQFFIDLVWMLPDALKAPAWTREDVL